VLNKPKTGAEKRVSLGEKGGERGKGKFIFAKLAEWGGGQTQTFLEGLEERGGRRKRGEEWNGGKSTGIQDVEKRKFLENWKGGLQKGGN